MIYLLAIVSALLILTILLQHRASGLSSTFGGSGATNVVQRRGAEKLIYRLSVLLSIVFFLITIAMWYV